MDPSKLLLVDSDARSVRVLEVSLKKVGYEVSTAQTIQTAVVAAEASPPDLIITEVNLADGRGFELCKAVREQPSTRNTAVIFLAEEATPEAKIAAINVGADAFLTKPVFVNEILAQIQSLLEKKRTDSITRRERPGNLSGNLANMGVVDLLQLMETGRKSGIVHVSSDRIKSGGFVAEGQERGTMFFREGQVIDSRLGKLRGVEAVYRTLLWDDGVFEIEFKNVSREDVVRSTTQSILLEGMRRVDEWSRFSEVLPPMSARLAVDYGALGRAFDEVPAAMRPVLHLFDGKRSLFEVVNDAPMSDTEALAIVSRLHDHGVLQRSQTQTQAPEVERSDDEVEAWLSSPQDQGPAPGALPSALGRAVIPSPHTPSEILQADDPLAPRLDEVVAEPEPEPAAAEPEATELPSPLLIPDRPSVVLSRHTVPANRSIPLTQAPSIAPEAPALGETSRTPSIVRQRVSSVVARAPVSTSNVHVPPSSSIPSEPTAPEQTFDPEITVTDGKPYRPSDSEIENAVDAAAQADEVFRSVRARSPSYVLAADTPLRDASEIRAEHSGADGWPPAHSQAADIAPTQPPPAGFVEEETPRDPIATTIEEEEVTPPGGTPDAVLARLPPVREEQPTEELSNFRNEFFDDPNDLGIEPEGPDWQNRAVGALFVFAVAAVLVALLWNKDKPEEAPPPGPAELGKKTVLPNRPLPPSQPSLRPAPGTPAGASGIAGASGLAALAAPSGASGVAAASGPSGASGVAALAGTPSPSGASGAVVPPPKTPVAPPKDTPKAAPKPKNSDAAASATSRGDAALKRGKIGAAKANFKKALAADATFARAHAGLALVYLEEGKDRSAKASAWRALKQDRGSARAHLVLGMVATNAGKMDDAKKAYQRFLKYESKGPQAEEVRRILSSMP